MKQKSDDSRESSLEIVGVPGLEPGKTGPESVVLPITPYPNLRIFKMPSRRRCKSTHSHWNGQIIPRFFRAKFYFSGARTFSPCVVCLRSALTVHFTSGAAIEVGQAATQLTQQSTLSSHFALTRRVRPLFSFPKSKTATTSASDVVAVLKVNCPCGRK